MMFIRYIYLLIISFCFIFSEQTEYPKPIDFNKGIEIPDIVKSLYDDDLVQPISSQAIDKIKSKAKAYIPEPVSDNDIIIFETSAGTFKGHFFNQKAPNHCLNFKKLANSGFYDGTKFHRVIPNFMIQGGDILSRDGKKSNDGTGNPGWTVDAEFNDINHIRGTLSMARSSDPNSAGSQFFVCVAPQKHLDGQYTAFGQITDKVRIIDHIVNSPTDSQYAVEQGKNSIPDGEDMNNWIMLRHPKTRKPLFYEVPKHQEKNSYKREMMLNLRSNNPVIPVYIKTVRVINGDDLND